MTERRRPSFQQSAERTVRDIYNRRRFEIDKVDLPVHPKPDPRLDRAVRRVMARLRSSEVDFPA